MRENRSCLACAFPSSPSVAHLSPPLPCANVEIVPLAAGPGLLRRLRLLSGQRRFNPLLHPAGLHLSISSCLNWVPIHTQLCVTELLLLFIFTHISHFFCRNPALFQALREWSMSRHCVFPFLPHLSLESLQEL